jgi:hypothetical protein
MSTLKTTNLQHPSAASPAIVLDADGDATYSGVHDFSAATVTGAPQGLVLVASQVVGTAVSSVTLTSVFSADYDSYLITYLGGVASAGVYLTGRLGSTSTGYYETRLVTNIPAGTVGNNYTQNGAELRFGAGNTSGAYIVSHMHNPFLTQPTYHTADQFDPTQMARFTSILNNSTSYTDFTIFSNAGTITGGTVRVYGYSKG